MDNSVKELTLPAIAVIATERAEPTLAERQRGDPYLMSVIVYLEDNVLMTRRLVS